MAKVLKKASPTLAKPLQPKNASDQGKLNQRLAHAGFRSEAAPGLFLSLKFVGLLVGFVLAGGAMIFTGLTQSCLDAQSSWSPAVCSICQTWPSGSSPAAANRPCSSACPTPWT